MKEDVVKKLMKPSVAALVAGAVLAGVGLSSRLFDSPDAATAAKPAAPAKPCGPGYQFGHIKSLTRRGNGFELRFDPAWFLSGVTANQAMLEDTGSSDVPNDNYVVEEGHRLLTYLVPATAHVTVLVRGGTPDARGFPSKAITAAQLTQLVSGKAPIDLAEDLESGFWMRYDIDTVCSLEQQYRP
jgi:hypothetical protein